MTDPLADVVSLLQLGLPSTKLVSARGPWRVRRSESEKLFYCCILDGSSRLAPAGETPLVLNKGDFVLVPSASQFTASSVVPPPSSVADARPTRMPTGEMRVGGRGAPDVRMLIGYAHFASADAPLLLSLLPRLVLVHGEARLATLVQLVRDESLASRPARDVVLARLLEVLLIEALRSAGTASSPGLVRGLADPRVASALRSMHANPAGSWSVVELAKEAGLSRSTFFERFQHAVGVAPMEYLLGWRIALAKDLLRREKITVAEVAPRVGYSSASTFSVAFTRHVGLPPSQYAKVPERS